MNSIASLIVVCSVLTVAPPSAAAGHVSVVEQGKPAASIVMPANPSATLKTAAGEIAAYVKRISGAPLEIGSTGTASSRIVLEVSSAAIPQEDAFRIVTRPGEIRLIGGGEMGVLYAAYAFLEDLGVRWLVPGAEGERIPRSETIRYPQTDRKEIPSFRCRFFYVRNPDAVLWAVRNRLNGFFPPAFAPDHGNPYYLPSSVSSIHSFADVLPPEKYFDYAKTYRVTMEVWGQSDSMALLICSQGRARGSSQGGVWKPLPRQGRLTGRPEWCALTFTVPPDMLDRATRRQTFGFGGGDSQVWVAEIRFEACADGRAETKTVK